MTPLVSAVLPTYNQAPFVESAVMSAVEQDYPDLQVVVSDDGSSDGTDEIVQELARRYPERVTAIVGQPNVGVTENCNRALRACRGELVAFLAGDDLWLPGKISRQVEWLAEDERRVLCGHDVEQFDSETGQRIRLWSELQVPPAGADARLFVRNGHPWHPLGNMTRRRVIPRRGFDTRIPLASDWKFFVDCVAHGGEFGQIPGVYARYRSWSGNVSRRRAEMLADMFRTLDLIEEEYPWLADAARENRVDQFLARGHEALLAGRAREARADFTRAAFAAPHRMLLPRAVLRVLFTLLPASIRTQVLRARSRRRAA